MKKLTIRRHMTYIIQQDKTSLNVNPRFLITVKDVKEKTMVITVLSYQT